MKKRIKYYFLCFIGYSPIIFGVAVLLFIWFIQLPYKSTYYYVSPVVTCCECEIELGVDEKFCPVCSKSVKDIAVVNTYKHCNFCTSNELYKNDTVAYCKNCGKTLAEEKRIALAELGFSNIKSFRNAIMFDNFKRLVSNKIVTTIIVIALVIVSKNLIYQAMFRAAKRKILRDGRNKTIW